ncbi:hypothetical protein [Streptomyces sp. NPDC056480]|uniref:hypothetical protein n=1 Tax=Streptomyces sp. NPDC056480 TaxID=3345833 RepID=UPI0036B52C11
MTGSSATVRRALSSTVVVCSVLLSTGCGAAKSGGGASGATPSRATGATPTATPTVAAAVDSTRTVRVALDATGRTTARTSVRTELGKGSVPAYVISGKGAHDFAEHRGTVSIGIATAARFEEVLADGRVYIRGAAGDETMPWSYVDRDEVEARHILRAPANDPEYTLRQAAMGERFQQVGEEDLNGSAVTRYRGLLTHEALTLQMNKEMRAKTDRLRDLMGGLIPATVDVWVDSRKRAVQVRLSMTIEGAASSVNTLTLTELGRPVKVTVPAAEAAESDASILG